MKKFNKVLAIVLTIFTLVASLPISVFADAWLDVDATTEGSSSTVQVTVDAGTLADILEKDGISADLLEDIKAGVSVDVAALKEVFTVSELLEIIPRESWLDIFDVDEIMDAIGIENLSKYVDIPTLLQSADSEALANLLKSIPEIEKYVDVVALIDGNYIAKSLVLQYVYKAQLAEALKGIDAGTVSEKILTFTPEEINEMVDVSGLISADPQLVDLTAVLDMSKAETAVKNAGLTAAEVEPYAKTAAAKTLLEGKFDTYEEREELINGGYVTGHLDGSNYVIDTVDVEKLVADDKLTVAELVEADAVDVSGLAKYLVDNNRVNVQSVIDLEKVKTQLSGVDNSKLITYVNTEKALDKIGVETVIQWLGGYGAAKQYINDSALIAALDLKAVLASIPADKLDSMVDFAEISKQISVNQILNVIPMNAVFAQIDNDELLELVDLIGVKQYIMPVLTTVFNKVMKNVDKLELNGYVVAEEDSNKILAVNSANLVKAIASVIPSLDDFATMTDGKLISMELGMTYSVDGTVPAVQKTKNITFEFVLEGDLSRLQNVAAKLDSLLRKYIDFDITGGVVTLDVYVPGVATKLYARVLDADKLPDELKVKVLRLQTLDGNDAAAFVESLTFGEIIALLDAVEPTKLYNSFLNISYVNAAIEKVEAKTGYDLSEVTLDDMVDVAANVPSMERICEIIENKTGKDLMAYIETVAGKADSLVDRAEKIEAVQNILDKVSAKLNVDLGALSAADIVDRAKDAPISETVFNVIASKIGVDVKAVLETYTADELYQLAVDKAAALEGAYNKVKNYVLVIADKIPDRLMNADLSDLYEGDGVFGGAKSVTVNAKALVEKTLNKILSKLNISTSAADMLLNQINGGTVTVGADISIHFQNLHEITYLSRDGKTVLFKAYLPTGADLEVFKNNSDVTGYEFVAWTDKDGNVIETMPDADTKVYADRNVYEVKFENENSDLIGTIMVEDGDSLAKYADALAEIAAKVDLSGISASVAGLYDGVYTAWYEKTANGLADRVFANTPITKDIVVVGTPKPDYFLKFEGDVDYDVTVEDGEYVVSITSDMPEDFILDLDDAHPDKNKLTVASAKLGYDVLVLNGDTLAQLYGKADASVKFSFTTADEAPDSFKGTVYETAADSFYSFEITTDGAEFTDNFASDIRIQVPYTKLVDNALNQKIRVRTYKNGVRECPESDVVALESGDYVWFNAKHFSDFVVAYESAMILVITDGNNPVNGTLVNGGDLYFPAGYEITLNFEVPGYKVIAISSQVPGEDAVNYDITKVNTLIMDEKGVTVTVTVEPTDFYIYYHVNGEILLTDTYNLSDLSALAKDEDILKAFATVAAGKTAPTGYTTPKAGEEWAGFNADLLGVADMHLYANWAAIEYTVVFKDAKTFTGVTVENYATKVTEPAVPAEEGYLGAWKAYDLSKLAENAVNGVYTIEAKYDTKLSYTISTDGNVTVNATASYGDNVTVTVKDEKYDLDYYDVEIVVTKISGGTETVTDGKFTMPADNVYVSVVATPKEDLTYTVNGEEFTGTYGETYSYRVELPLGKIMTSVPAGWTLASYETDSNAVKTLVFEFKLTENNMAYTYELEDSTVALFKIFNGKLFDGDGTPESTQKGVSFTEWSNTVAGSLVFAMFAATGTQSLLWLWILLAVLLLIAIIAILYALYITGKIKKPLFLLRFVTWIVGLFFSLCLAISALGLKIAKLFGKSDDPDDYGFEKEPQPEELPVEDENTDAVATETVETEENAENVAEAVVAAEAVAEAAEEATEEAATEEVAEAATEEAATEEVADAATEEAATEEVAEEATEEVATEEVAEEATEEAATEEVAEEATEEAATEEVAEEATEEEPKKASDEENKKNN